MINQGPRFLSYLNIKDETPVNTSVWPLLNQAVTSEEIILQRYFTRIDKDGMLKKHTNGQYPSGPSSFVTSLPLDKDFDQAQSITLHRYLDTALKGKLIDFCVDSMTIKTGYQSSITKYVFDINSAICNPGGTVFKYYHSLYYPGTDAVDKPRFGHVENRYHNGLAAGIDNITDTTLPEKIDANGLLDGQLISRKTYDAEGKLLVSETKKLTVFTSITCNEKRVNLFGGYTRCVRNELIEDGVEKTNLYDFEPQFGKIKEERFDNIDGEGKVQTLCKAYTYAFQAYPWFLARNVIDTALTECNTVIIPAQNKKKLTTGASLQTYISYPLRQAEQTEPAVYAWGSARSYVLQEPVANPCGDLKKLTEQKPDQNWLLVNTVLQRTPHGTISQQQDVSTKVETIILCKDEVLPIAQFNNSGGNECSYTGFEEYENYQPIWRTTDRQKNIADLIVEGDAQTGFCSLQLSPGSTIEKTGPIHQSQTCVLSSWIKAPAGFNSDSGEVKWEISGPDGTKNVTVTALQEGSWIYWQTVVKPVGKAGQPVSLRLTNNKKTHSLLFNDILYAPLTGEIEIKVYDPVYKDEIATLGSNADITRYAYDPFRNKAAQIGPVESVKKGIACYNNREWFTDDLSEYQYPQQAPNSDATIVAGSGGLYETFTKGQDIWNAWKPDTKEAWQVEKGRLIHTGAVKNSISWVVTAHLTTYAIGFSAISSAPDGISLGIAVGTNLSVDWSAQHGWSMHTGDTHVIDPVRVIKKPVNVLLVPFNDRVYLFADGRQVFAQKTDSAVWGQCNLSAQGDISFTNLITYCNPQLSLDYKNASGHIIQQQNLEQKRCLIKQTLYNALGNEVVVTKIAGYDTNTFGYKADFVKSMNWNTGIMTGAVSDYYPGDEGYPYSRVIYEKSSLARPLQKGIPGKAFAVTVDNPHVTSRQYGIEDQAAIREPAITTEVLPKSQMKME